MPHKHKRKRDDDNSNFDLAPTTKAKPLPAYTVPSVFTSDQNGASNKRRKPSKKPRAQDDTPRAFARMMAWQAAGNRPSGLDDGIKKPKKKPKKKENTKDAQTIGDDEQISGVTSEALPEALPTAIIKPQILPGESLRDFARRVDQTLSLSAMAQSSAKANLNIPSDIKPRERLTKHNKRLQRMISDWRTTDARLKEKKEEEEVEEDDEDKEEQDLLWAGVKSAGLNRKGKKKKAKNGATAAADDDPWKDLEKKRREAKQKNLQDVVKAPPALVKIRSKFKTRDEDFANIDGRKISSLDADVGVDVENVPNAVGSLRRREEMSRKRKEVIESYRKLNGRKLKGKNLSGGLHAITV